MKDKEEESFGYFPTIEIEKVNQEKYKIKNNDIKQTIEIVQPYNPFPSWVVVTMNTLSKGMKRVHEYESSNSVKGNVPLVNNEFLVAGL